MADYVSNEFEEIARRLKEIIKEKEDGRSKPESNGVDLEKKPVTPPANNGGYLYGMFGSVTNTGINITII